MADIKQPALLTPEEVATYVKFELKTVYAWIQRGEFPNVIKVGRSYRIPEPDVQEFLNKYAATPSRVGRRIISPGRR